MGLFARRREERDANLGQLLRAHGIGTRLLPASVPADTALRSSAVWACVQLVSSQIASLPLDHFRRLPDGSRTEVRPPAPWIDQPSVDFDVTAWRHQAVASLLLQGNVYWLATVDDRGAVRTLEPVPAERVSWRQRQEDGRWETRVDGRPVERWPVGPLVHVAGWCLPGLPYGVSVLKYASLRVSLALNAEQWGIDFLERGAVPSGVISTTEPVNAEQARIVKERFVAAVGSREPVVLGSGLKYEPTLLSADDSQFLATIQASAADIARFFLVPPELIGASSGASLGASLTYANIESRFLHFRQIALTPWMTRLERAWSALLPRPQYVRFNRDAVVAVDLSTRYRAHDLAIRDGWRSRNEVRELEDLPPIPGGDEHLWPPYAISAQAVAPPVSEADTAAPTRRLVARRGEQGWVIEEVEDVG